MVDLRGLENLDGNVTVEFTRHVGGTTYQEPSWWVLTDGRGPDIGLGGPYLARQQALRALQAGEIPAVRRVLRGYYTEV